MIAFYVLWLTYWIDLIEEVHRLGMTATQPEEQQICDETDCVRIYKHLTKKTSPGPDGIPYEAFMYAGKDLIESMQRMFNIIWQMEEILDQWKRYDIKVIYKNKGSKEDLANYRGIFLSSVQRVAKSVS